MTHAESQDLLLDLAYGELDVERAAEVASHVEGCDECRKEKAAIEEARRIAGPLRELEQPSAGFDDRILAAARAQAQLTHDGNVGQVIEVTGSVRPLGMEPARIDAHGPVKARPAERRRPRWLLRAALGGSVAAAATLALVVSTSLETRRTREMAAVARSDEYKISVEPVGPRTVDTAPRDAEPKREKERAPEPQKLDAAPPPAQEAPGKDKVAQVRAPRNRAAAEGSGGDVASRASAPASNAAEADLKKQVPAAKGARAEEQPSAPAVSTPHQLIGGPVAALAPPKAEQQGQTAEAGEAVPARVPSSKSVAAPQAARVAGTLSAVPVASLETSAQEARHAGDYARAASLYRQAAALRENDKDLSAAAWNLAHAVECLSAAGQFAEARAVRDQLARAYPSETNALSAARRALREVESPVPAEH